MGPAPTASAIVPADGELDVHRGWRPIKTGELALVGQHLLHPFHPADNAASAAQEQIQRNMEAKLAVRF